MVLGFQIKNSIRRFSEPAKKIDFQRNKDSLVTDAGKVKYAQPIRIYIFRRNFNVLTSKNNANIEVRFNNVFPCHWFGLNLTNKQ